MLVLQWLFKITFAKSECNGHSCRLRHDFYSLYVVIFTKNALRNILHCSHFYVHAQCYRNWHAPPKSGIKNSLCYWIYRRSLVLGSSHPLHAYLILLPPQQRNNHPTSAWWSPRHSQPFQSPCRSRSSCIPLDSNDSCC